MTGSSTTDRIDSLTDPASLRDRDDIDVTEATQQVAGPEFERRAAWDGTAVVGVLDGNDRLLLAKLGDGHGWMLPNGPVEPGDDYAEAARTWTERTTGVAIAPVAVERVHVKHYRTNGDRETTGHHVVFRGVPTDDTAVSDGPALPVQDVERVGWFAEPPADADWDHGDFANDVHHFLDT
jgi:ADP-ribose pyrophosphatase YjhB (NUDIX family)